VTKVTQKYEEMRDQLKALEIAGWNVAHMFTQLEEWHEEALNKIESKTEDTTSEISRQWDHLFTSLQDLTADWLADWKFSLDSLVDLFKRTAAQAAAYWIWGDQSKGFSLGNMFGGGWGGTAEKSPESGGGAVSSALQGANAAKGLSGAYGAYTSAGGGWAGLKAGAGSFFGGSSAALLNPYTAAILAATYVISHHEDDYESYYRPRKVGTGIASTMLGGGLASRSI